ncbi:hypothetical protein DKX38_003920 [Salix brachista]|uniref:Uncharacterized protein n=1 Tax=Salix brachista TaxID=2182728 RepID=A0A5N5NBW7_9ROSI|nr:hypothetical protein DKX38_003920 [Salix brachista]
MNRYSDNPSKYPKKLMRGDKEGLRERNSFLSRKKIVQHKDLIVKRLRLCIRMHLLTAPWMAAMSALLQTTRYPPLHLRLQHNGWQPLPNLALLVFRR